MNSNRNRSDNVAAAVATKAVSLVQSEAFAAAFAAPRVAKLLETAILRGYSGALQQLTILPTAQHLTSKGILQLLQAAVLACSLPYLHPSDVDSIVISRILGHLLQLPAAAKLTGEQLTAVIITAVQSACDGSCSAGYTRSLDSALKPLCRLPAAARLTTDAILPLMQLVAAHLNSASVISLCSLPASQHNTATDCVR